jgi:hypothetical protein
VQQGVRNNKQPKPLRIGQGRTNTVDRVTLVGE